MLPAHFTSAVWYSPSIWPYSYGLCVQQPRHFRCPSHNYSSALAQFLWADRVMSMKLGVDVSCILNTAFSRRHLLGIVAWQITLNLCKYTRLGSLRWVTTDIGKRGMVRRPMFLLWPFHLLGLRQTKFVWTLPCPLRTPSTVSETHLCLTCNIAFFPRHFVRLL